MMASETAQENKQTVTGGRLSPDLVKIVKEIQNQFMSSKMTSYFDKASEEDDQNSLMQIDTGD